MGRVFNLRRDELCYFINNFPESIYNDEIERQLEWGVLNNLNRRFIKKLKENYIGSQPIQIELSEVELENLNLYLKHCKKILLANPKAMRMIKELTKS